MRHERSTHLEMIELGRSRFGIVTRKQLIEAGFGPSLVEYHVKIGLLWPVFRGVYAIGRRVESQKAVWMAATLAAGPDAVIAGLSAAEYWGMVGHRNLLVAFRPRSRKVMEGRLGPNERVRLYILRRHCLPELSTCREGIPVRTVVGTLIDLAGALPERQLEKAVYEASRLGLLDSRNVARLRELSAGHRGAESLRHLLRWWLPETVNILSVLEGLFQKLCLEHGLDMPGINRTVAGLKVDFVWKKQKVVVETDGFAFHDGVAAFQRDHARTSRLARAGYLRLPFTYWQVVESPDEVIEAVLVALETWSPDSG